jgi:hypothetical protein
MTTNIKGYNGWNNFETWCVYLWLTNEEGTYRHWRKEAERHQAEAPTHVNVRQGIWTIEQATRYTLGQAIEEDFEAFHPFRGDHVVNRGEPSIYCELLDAALSEVRWDEIAEAFLEDL